MSWVGACPDICQCRYKVVHDVGWWQFGASSAGATFLPCALALGDQANVQMQCPGCSRKFYQQACMATYSDVEAAVEELHVRVWQHCSQHHMDLTWDDIKDLRVTCYSLD